MPSERRQLNVRLDPVSSERFDRLLPLVQQKIGVELSQAQFVALALAALEEKHAGQGEGVAQAPPTSKPGKKSGK